MAAVKVQNSETMLTFFALGLLAAITELAASPEFKASLGAYATVIIFSMSMLAMWLRKYTTKPLAPVFKKKAPKTLNPIDQALKDDADSLEE